jgi:hypothetical protein
MNRWFLRIKRPVILSLSKDLGRAAKEIFQRLIYCAAKILRLKRFVLRSE